MNSCPPDCRRLGDSLPRGVPQAYHLHPGASIPAASCRHGSLHSSHMAHGPLATPILLQGMAGRAVANGQAAPHGGASGEGRAAPCPCTTTLHLPLTPAPTHYHARLPASMGSTAAACLLSPPLPPLNVRRAVYHPTPAVADCLTPRNLCARALPRKHLSGRGIHEGRITLLAPHRSRGTTRMAVCIYRAGACTPPLPLLHTCAPACATLRLAAGVAWRHGCTATSHHCVGHPPAASLMEEPSTSLLLLGGLTSGFNSHLNLATAPPRATAHAGRRNRAPSLLNAN